MSKSLPHSPMREPAPSAVNLAAGRATSRLAAGLDGGRLLRALLLAGIAGLVVKLLLTGQMVKYMSPSLDGLTIVAAGVTLVMAVIELSLAWSRPPTIPAPAEPAHEADHGHDHDHDHRHGGAGEQALTLLLLGGTLAVGLLFTPRALTPAALGGEDLASYLLAFGSPASPHAAAGALSPEQPIEEMPGLIAHIRLAGEASIGQTVRVTGLVAPTHGLQPGEFTIMRYSVVHCVADARPFGLLIAEPPTAVRPMAQWVRVEGRLGVRDRQGSRLLTIEATSVTAIDEPNNPYIPPLF